MVSKESLMEGYTSVGGVGGNRLWENQKSNTCYISHYPLAVRCAVYSLYLSPSLPPSLTLSFCLSPCHWHCGQGKNANPPVSLWPLSILFGVDLLRPLDWHLIMWYSLVNWLLTRCAIWGIIWLFSAELRNEGCLWFAELPSQSWLDRLK